MANQSKIRDMRTWKKWKESGAIGNINGIDLGTAYAFFDCDASLDYLKDIMQGIQEDSESPKGLELAVQEGVEGLKLDEKLAKAIKYPYDYRIMSHERMIQCHEEEKRPAESLKYSLVTKCPDMTNETVAKRTGNIMNYVRTLNQDTSVFRCAVVYEKDGEYNLIG
jgi:hypothetical protein